MPGDYLPIVLLAGLAVLFAVGSFAVSALLRPKAPSTAKSLPYECGIVPERVPRGERFPVKFYVVAMLFIIFDIETIFLFPWAIAFRQLGLFGLIEMAIFIALVFVAYIYVRRKGGLDWSLAGLREEHQAQRPEDEPPPAPRDREVARAG
jgi:NADH-quinone oxidoreductase subunit A